jgi:hypothetical protein
VVTEAEIAAATAVAGAAVAAADEVDADPTLTRFAEFDLMMKRPGVHRRAFFVDRSAMGQPQDRGHRWARPIGAMTGQLQA